MKILTKHLATLWYENEAGDKFIPNLRKCGPDPPEGFIYQHSMFPRQISHSILRFVIKEEVEACPHPPDDVRKTDGWVNGIEGRECNKCHGSQVKNIGEPWPKEWEAHGARQVFSMSSTWSSDLVLALVSELDYTLEEAVLISATACERCMNVLAHDCGLDWGYSEGSDKWKNSPTSCKFCKEMK